MLTVGCHTRNRKHEENLVQNGRNGTGVNQCPGAACHTLSGTDQDATCLVATWTHAGSGCHPAPPSLSSFPATLSHPAVLQEVIVTQGQDPALGFADSHMTGSGWFSFLPSLLQPCFSFILSSKRFVRNLILPSRKGQINFLVDIE